MLETGTKAPDFELPDQNGNMHKLSDYAGKKVILYFYPKDNTAGCTKQACGFSDRYPPVSYTHLGCEQETVEKVRAYLKELDIFDEILETRAGGVVSSHCGPGTLDRKSTRLNSSHINRSRMPSSA